MIFWSNLHDNQCRYQCEEFYESPQSDESREFALMGVLEDREAFFEGLMKKGGATAWEDLTDHDREEAARFNVI
jgi:hypothetical protein